MNPTAGIGYWIFLIVFFGGLLFFFYEIWQKYLLLKVAKPENRFDNVGERIKRVLLFAFGQKRILADPQTGLMHAFIFWGFCVLALRTITVFGKGFYNKFLDSFIFSTVGHYYLVMKDIFVILVLIMIIYATIRRAFIKPKRLDPSWEGYLILFFIFVLMVTDMLMDGVEFKHNPAAVAFIGPFMAKFLGGMGESSLATLYNASWWIHIVTLLVFLNELPRGKHFHVITAIPNVYFQKLEPKGKIKTIENLEELFDSEDDDIPVGISKITDFTWKQYMDLYTCTECGRCHEFCPTFLTDKPLSPKRLNDKLKHFLYDHQKELISGKGEELEPVVGEVVSIDEIWDCTTCGRCEEACPVFIENIPRIVDMRRKLVMVEGDFPSELQTAFQGMERNGNPWNIGMSKRFEWAEGLDIPTMAEVDNPEEIEVLFWVGCAGSFDDRAKKISRAFAQILQKAGVKFACLGEEEMCCGDFARRSGEEFLYQTLAQQNVEVLNEYKVKDIVTICPHGYNTLKHEYKDFGGDYNVYHHTEFIAKLIKEGKIKPSKEIASKVTYHDSCYLGRHNGIYDEPRDILKSISGVKLEEAGLNREKGLCCGAGGGRMFMEETRGSRINHKRIEDIMEHGKPDTVCTACPFCMTMLRDAVNEKEIEGVDTKDIAELVLESLE